MAACKMHFIFVDHTHITSLVGNDFVLNHENAATAVTEAELNHIVLMQACDWLIALLEEVGIDGQGAIEVDIITDMGRV